MTKVTREYLVGTNGLTGNCKYYASDPDEALMFAHRHERFLQITKNHPGISADKAIQIAKDECDMPNFRIDYCILQSGG